MLRKNLFALLGAIVVLSMVLGACTTPTPETIIQTVEVPVEVEVEVPVEVPVTPEPEPIGPKTLVVCQGQEPDTLYWYGGSMSAARHIQHAIYDGPIDNRTYDYQPVILEKLPSLEDGDGAINVVTVQAGDMIVDDAGDAVELEEGFMIRPAGCYESECAIEFDGTPVEMDQMEATFKMIEGVTWSDGVPVTADDSVYSYELVGDPDTATSRFGYDRTASYVAVDDLTAVWTGLPGFIDSTFFINFYTPMPRHHWQEELDYSALDLIEAEESSRTPIGWGAFIIEEWVPGDHITVVKNPYYYRADEGLPYVETIIFRFVDNSNSAVAQLISGECDIATQDTAMEDQSELLLQLEQEGVVEPIFMTGTVWEHVDFSINPIDEYDRPDFFEDLRVRQAFAYCLDRQSVVDAVLFGRSMVINSYIPPEHPLYAADRVVEYAFDPEQGMALLDEVGWVDTDGDGMREAQGVEGIADGTPLAFSWKSTTAAMRVEYMQIYQQNLLECGFDVTLENLPAAEYFADGPEGPLFGRRFDVGSFAWLTGVEPPCDLYRGLSTDIPSEDNGWGGQNDVGFMNEEFDAACIRALTSLPGSEDYIDGHKEAQRIFSEQLPVVPLFLRLKIAANRPGISGFIMDATENSEMWNIEAFDLDM